MIRSFGIAAENVALRALVRTTDREGVGSRFNYLLVVCGQFLWNYSSFPVRLPPRVLLIIKLSARLYWRTPVAGSGVHLSSVNDGNTSLC